MYKLLLSGRYLRTRFIALASIVSVMLGVATMIVVNSVMAGFSTQMKDRLHGILADVMVESMSTDGFEDPEDLMALVREIAGDEIEAMTPTIEIYGMMSYDWIGQPFTQQVTLVGVLPEGKDLVSPLRTYLMSRQALVEDGRVLRPAQRDLDHELNWEPTAEAMEHRRNWLDQQRLKMQISQSDAFLRDPQPASSSFAADPFQQTFAATAINPAAHETGDGDAVAAAGAVEEFSPESLTVSPDELFGPSNLSAAAAADPDLPLPARVYVGIGLVSYPYVEKETGKTRNMMMLEPGQDVKLTTVTAGTPEPTRFAATVVDVVKSGMSEYDSTLVFCNLEELQFARKMLLPSDRGNWKRGAVTSLQIKLKDYDHAPEVVQRLLDGLPADAGLQVRTWEQKQGPLLQAVEVESAILNVLLFLIIAVAGFGILAIFYMIVVEKTRDIGVLKSLGAGSGGVMSIFLAYGLGLGVVGSGVGVILGLLFVRYINEIEDVLSWITGRKVFDEAIYYFDRIPTAVNPGTVLCVALGAMVIAVLASVLPARHAARLDPVQALRYE